MAVYIDHARMQFRTKRGRVLRMSHMIADTPTELRVMAQAIGVALHHIQSEGTYREHFDVCEERRARALALGARSVTMVQLGALLRARRRKEVPPCEP